MDDLVENWDSPVKNASQVEEAVPVLRRALAGAGPGEVNRPITNGLQTVHMQVVIASLGFLTNLAGLLASPPDQISDLAGRDLVREKVLESGSDMLLSACLIPGVAGGGDGRGVSRHQRLHRVQLQLRDELDGAAHGVRRQVDQTN